MTRTKPRVFLSLFLVLMLVVSALPTAAFAADVEDTHTHEETMVVTTEPTEPAAEETTAPPETPTEPVTEETVLETEAPTGTEEEQPETTPPVEETTVSPTEPEPETPEEEPTPAATSGYIGESAVYWEFDASTGFLKISGSGGCETFASAEDQPWKHLREQIKQVWFYDVADLSIENLAFWFEGCTALESVELPYTTFILGQNAFAGCPALKKVTMYYTETPPVIETGAFYVDTLTVMEILYIPFAVDANAAVHTHDWNAENRAVYFLDVYGMSQLASGWCQFCQGTHSYTLSYEYWTENIHSIRHWCSNCGKDQCGGANAADHSYNSSGNCTYCGHYNSSYDNSGSSGGGNIGGGTTTCYHTSTYYSWSGCTYYEYCRNCGEYMGSGTSHGSTYTSWSGCNWYDYCRDCDELMDYGTSHGSYSYGSWEYYNSSRHRRYYSCSDCGEGSYTYGYHSTSTQYSQYTSTQHQKGSYCSTCSSYVGSTTNENHTFSYGSWSNYSSSQHRRTKSCSACGYSTYEYASHSLTNGSWTSYDGTQHRRTVSCSCGYSTYEYANHSLSYGGWTNYSSSQHRRSVSCSCGYSSYEYASHSLVNGSWTSASDTQHSRKNTCSCGYSTTESENHDLTYGNWDWLNEEQHTRTKSCSCGYSSTETAAHTWIPGQWEAVDGEQHKRPLLCTCGETIYETADHTDTDDNGYCDDCDYLLTRFSVTVPASMALAMADNGEIYTATDVEIVNYSTGAVKVTGVTVTANGNWTIVPYNYNIAAAKVDSKQIGFAVNGAHTTIMGNTEALNLGGGWEIARGASLPLAYDAIVSATSQVIQAKQVLTLVFVIDWAA